MFLTSLVLGATAPVARLWGALATPVDRPRAGAPEADFDDRLRRDIGLPERVPQPGAHSGASFIAVCDAIRIRGL